MLERRTGRIAVYADQDSLASPSPVDREMARVFAPPRFRIETADRHDLLRPDFYDGLVLLVVPGIRGEVSLYHDHIGPANALIRAYVARGGGVFGMCAGASYVAAATEFQPEWAAHRARREGLLGLFNGIARGPVPGLGVDGNDPRHHRGLTTVRLAVEDERHPLALLASYSSGPTFLPAAGQDMHVIARYADGPAREPAIVRFGYGRGVVVLSGPVPHNGALPPTGLEAFAALDALSARLLPHERARQRLFDALMRIFRCNARENRLVPF